MASSTFKLASKQQSSLTRTTSPSKDPRNPACCPCTPGKTAKLWDEYERLAIENARRREPTSTNKPLQTSRSQRHSSGPALEKSYKPFSSGRSREQSPTHSVSKSQKSKFGYRNTYDTASSTTLAICKTCKQAIDSTTGICERCKRTIVLQPPIGESTPPLTSAARNFASTDLPQLHKKSTSAGSAPLSTTSPHHKTHKRSPHTQHLDSPIKMSPLPIPNTPEGNNTSSSLDSSPLSSRKTSLTDPNEPFLRLQISRTKPSTTTPTSATTTTSTTPFTPSTPPPSTTHSRTSTRPSSLANITTPPQILYYQHQHQYTTSTSNTTSTSTYTRHDSATPSELSTLYPYFSFPPISTSSPPSVTSTTAITAAHLSAIQNATSAWDDWDSDSEDDGAGHQEEEKMGLVGYWRGMSMGRKGGKRTGTGKYGRGSTTGGVRARGGATNAPPPSPVEGVGIGGGRSGSVSKGVGGARDRESESFSVRRLGDGGGETDIVGKGKEEGVVRRKRRPGGFVRVISCGCVED